MFCEGYSLAHRAVQQGDWKAVSKVLHAYSDKHFLLLQNTTEISKATENSINHLLVFLSIISQVFGAGAQISCDGVTNDDVPADETAGEHTSAENGCETLLECCKSLPVSRLLPAISLKIVNIALEHCQFDLTVGAEKINNRHVQPNLSGVLAHACGGAICKMVRIRSLCSPNLI